VFVASSDAVFVAVAAPPFPPFVPDAPGVEPLSPAVPAVPVTVTFDISAPYSVFGGSVLLHCAVAKDPLVAYGMCKY
jgi:hypothetical protein